MRKIPFCWVGPVMAGLNSSAVAARLSAGALQAKVSLAAGLPLPGSVGIGVLIGALTIVAAIFAYLTLRLRKEKALFDNLFEHSLQAVSVTSVDDRLIRVNRRFTQIFGYGRQEVNGRRVSELILPPEAQDECRSHADLLARGQSVEAECVRRRRDGSLLPVAITQVRFFIPGRGAATYTIYRDLTEQRRADEIRLANEESWRAIFDNAALGIAVANQHAKFLAANPAYQKMTGYSEEELQAISFMDLSREEDRPLTAALFADLWAGRVPHYPMEKPLRRKDGQWIWVKVTASRTEGKGTTAPISIGVVEDISERMQAAAKLLEYERVVEGLQELIVVIDRDYHYLIANQAYLNYHGLKREQVLGHRVQEIVGQESFETLQGKLDECFQGKAITREVQFKYPGRGRRDILASYFPIEGPSGVDRIAVVLADITERKQAERDLQRSFEQLHALNAQLQSVREEERTSLARELHDVLAQSLTAIRIDLSALKTAPGGDHDSRGIDSILRQVDETIREVRRISTALRPGILDHLGLVAAVEWGAEDFQARTGIPCQVTLPKTNPEIDPERATALFRIFQETLTNVARHAGATRVQIGLFHEEEHLSLEVRDDGRGISPEQLSAYGSLGILGMRERVLLLGGEFRIAGASAGGTTVQVRIPCAGRPRPEVRP